MKQKTKKSVAKKFKVTGSGKIIRRSTGNNHYNSRDTGDQTRSKRRDQSIFKTEEHNLRRALPGIKIKHRKLTEIVTKESTPPKA